MAWRIETSDGRVFALTKNVGDFTEWEWGFASPSDATADPISYETTGDADNALSTLRQVHGAEFLTATIAERHPHLCAEGVHFGCSICGAPADPRCYLLPERGRGYPACHACVRRPDLISALGRVKRDAAMVALLKPICWAGESQGTACLGGEA